MYVYVYVYVCMYGWMYVYMYIICLSCILNSDWLMHGRSKRVFGPRSVFSRILTGIPDVFLVSGNIKDFCIEKHAYKLLF